MPTAADQINELKDALASAVARLAVAEKAVAVLEDKVEKLQAKQEASAERQARTEERLAAFEKSADRWAGRAWQVALAVWTTVMGLLGAAALAVLGFKK
ncbi:MAG: hypothetical protein C0501_28180 [Isosphaera sp.]|nr:hypothetical protein [Isosphaera sp.]